MKKKITKPDGTPVTRADVAARFEKRPKLYTSLEPANAYLTDEERESIADLLNIALEDTRQQFFKGNPQVDYGHAWAHAFRTRAESCEHVAAALARMGNQDTLAGAFRGLASELREVARGN